MMYYLLEIKALTPILVRNKQKGALVNGERTTIPATTLGGALVNNLDLKAGDVTLSDAFPITNNGFSMPLPKAALNVKVSFRGKRGIYFLGDKCRKESEREILEETVRKCIKPPRGVVKKASGLVVPLERYNCDLVYGKGAKLSKIIGEGDSVVIAPPTRSALPGLLFHYTYLKEGSKWWGLAISNKELPRKLELRIGGFKNKGFGKIELKFTKISEEIFRDPDFLLSPTPYADGIHSSLYREIYVNGKMLGEFHIKLRVKDVGSCENKGPVVWSPWGLSVNFSKLVDFLINRNSGWKREEI